MRGICWHRRTRINKVRLLFLVINKAYAEGKDTCTDTLRKPAFTSREVPTIDGVGGADRQVQLQKLVDCKLEDMQNAQLKITVGRKEVVVKEQVRKVVHAILSAKNCIGSAVVAEPHAALAWAGVLVVLDRKSTRLNSSH